MSSSPFPHFAHADSPRSFASAYTEITSPPPEMEQSLEGMPVRPMNLKVFYSFDEENKTNCLARWPGTLNIRTVLVDENTAIGIIDLKTCLQAIIKASPELVAKLGQDFTIYAYDYSEYETPLVGQGMLSWALASASPTPEAPATQSETIVTGRVTKNNPAFYGNGAVETLEVKLKLVPVPTALQKEYLETIAKYRAMSDVLGPDFDHQAWSSFVQANPGFFAGKSQLQRSSSMSIDNAGIGMVQQLLRENGSPQDTTGMQAIPQQNQSIQFHGSRAATPTMNQPPQQRRGSVASVSRPSSRASNRGLVQIAPRPPLKRAASTSAADASCTEPLEPEGAPPKKRAKVSKAAWPTSNSIEKQSESLRVAAGNAASVRTIYQPVAMKPAYSPASTFEEPVRPPTPIAKSGPNPKGRRSRPTGSNLRRESLSQEVVSPYDAPHAEPKNIDSGIGMTTSPDASGSNPNTPFNIPSSPPIYDGMTSAPNTPQLPPLRRDNNGDSGFISGAPTDPFFEDELSLLNDDWELPTLGNDGTEDTSLLDVGNIQGKSIVFMEHMPGDPSQLPRIMPRQTFNHKTKRKLPQLTSDTPSIPPSDVFSEQPQGSAPRFDPSVLAAQPQMYNLQSMSSQYRLDAPHQMQHPPPTLLHSASVPQIAVTASSRPNSRRPSGTEMRPIMPPPTALISDSAPQLTRTQSLGSVSLPHVAASDPVQPQPSQLQRSQTWGQQSQHPASDAPMSLKERARTGSGSGARRTQQIKTRLDSCIAQGEVPPYCENCGAIETPTWRKAFAKNFSTGWEHVSQDNGDGGYLWAEQRQWDDEGRVTQFRIIKKTVNNQDLEDGYGQMTLCNPCGLWLFKGKGMRPDDRWTKVPKDTKEKRKRPSRPRSKKKNNDGSNDAGSQANLDSTAITDGSSPDIGDNFEEEFDEDIEGIPPAKEPRLENTRPVAVTSNQQLDGDNHWAALERALQASPARNMVGSSGQIQLDESSSPSTRRVLFPSPRKEGEMKTLDGPSLRVRATQSHDSSAQSPAEASTSESQTTIHQNSQDEQSLLSPTPRPISRPASCSESPPALRRSPRLGNKQLTMANTESSMKVDAEDTAMIGAGDKTVIETQDKVILEDDDGLEDLFDGVTPPVSPTPAPAVLAAPPPEGYRDPTPPIQTTPTAAIPATPQRASRSSDRNLLETPSPATQAANFMISPTGMKSIYVQHVMDLMRNDLVGSVESAGDAELSRGVNEVLENRRPLQPYSSILADMMKSVCRGDINSNTSQTNTPIMEPAEAVAEKPTPSPPQKQASDLYDLDLPDLTDEWTSNVIKEFNDDMDTTNKVVGEQRTYDAGMTSEQEKAHIRYLMGHID